MRTKSKQFMNDLPIMTVGIITIIVRRWWMTRIHKGECYEKGAKYQQVHASYKPDLQLSHEDREKAWEFHRKDEERGVDMYFRTTFLLGVQCGNTVRHFEDDTISHDAVDGWMLKKLSPHMIGLLGQGDADRQKRTFEQVKEMLTLVAFGSGEVRATGLFELETPSRGPANYEALSPEQTIENQVEDIPSGDRRPGDPSIADLDWME